MPFICCAFCNVYCFSLSFNLLCSICTFCLYSAQISIMTTKASLLRITVLLPIKIYSNWKRIYWKKSLFSLVLEPTARKSYPLDNFLFELLLLGFLERSSLGFLELLLLRFLVSRAYLARRLLWLRRKSLMGWLMNVSEKKKRNKIKQIHVNTFW